jgi:hypothetical protein
MVGQPNEGVKLFGVFLNPALLCRFKTISRRVQRDGLRERKRFAKSGHAFLKFTWVASTRVDRYNR